MSLLHTRIVPLALFMLLFTSSLAVLAPSVMTPGLSTPVHDSKGYTVAGFASNASIPYADRHYGLADGIVDPKEYSYNYTDPVSGVTVYLEHNSTVLFVGLTARTSGWIGLAWMNYTEDFTTDGINGSDLILGYAPGTPHETIQRVTGSEAVTVHYKLFLRNGTLLQEGNVPDDTSTKAIRDESLLDGYKSQVYGMRIGETRHFIIPAAEGYTTSTNSLYGQDLEYVITLTRIGTNFNNPARSSRITYSDCHGISTFQHLADANRSQILAANASDDGTTTQLEYFIRMNSTDTNDIPLLNATDVWYPFAFMFGATEDFNTLPVQHSDWSSPLLVGLTPNKAPTITVKSPRQDEPIAWVARIEVNATDNTFVRRVFYRIDDENWTKLAYSFQTFLWESVLDLSKYENGTHLFRFNATDPSNVTTVISTNVTISRPYVPLLGMKLSVTRTVSTLLFHGTRVTDEFTVQNNGSAPIGAIELFLPRPFTSSFLSLTAEDGSARQLRVVELDEVGGMMHWRVHFVETVGFQESYVVKMVMFLHSLHTLTNFDSNLYELKFLKYPVVPYVISYASLSFGLRSGDTGQGVSPEGRTSNLPPMKIEEFALQLKSYTPLIEATRVTTVTVDPWGWLTYHETISIENIGPAKESTFAFMFPTYSTDIKVYDEVGILQKSQKTIEGDPWNQTIRLDVNLNERFGEVQSFWPGFRYTFQIEYKVLASSHQSPAGGASLLTIPMGTLGDMTVATHTVDVVLPASVDVLEVSKSYRLLYGVFDTTLRFVSTNTTEKNPPTVTLLYHASLWVAMRPIGFSLIFGLFAVAYVAYRKLKLPAAIATTSTPEEIAAEAKQAGAPPELLRRFAGTYSKKTSLELDMEKLEAGLKRGKVKKREFTIREGDIKTQLEKIDKELLGLEDEVVSYGPKYRDMVAQLELQEERIAGAKAGLNQLLIRKKKQRISAGAFEKTRQDYLKAIKKAVSATDRILLSIEEESGEF